MTDLLSRAELVKYFRTEEWADEVADIISNFPPAEGIDGLAQAVSEPVAYRVKDFADGWILCHTLEVAEHEADGQCLIQPLYAAQPPAAPVETIETGPVTVNEWEDECRSAAAAAVEDPRSAPAGDNNGSDRGPHSSAASERPEVSIVPMALSDGRTDYFVQIKVGDRAVTPHVFREEYKSAYHVALYDWLLNGSGEEPDCVEFGPDDWPGRVMPALPQPAPVTEKPRPSDCPWPVDCMWRHVPTVLEIGLHLCSRFGCPHRTSAQGVPDGSKAGPNYPGPVR